MLNFCCKLAVLYHGTAMVIAPLLKRAFGRNLNMRRKVKQLLATGMALAVLATNLMPVSLAAETAEELQTGEVATQALTDEIAARTFYHKDHIYIEPIRNGFELVNSETGEARPYVVVGCTNLIGSCDQKEVTYYGKIVSPSGTTNATCTSDKVFSYSATWVANSGIWFVDAADITVPNSKANHKFTNYVKKTEATCTKDATEIASCDYGCGKTNIRDIKGTKLGHDYSVSFAWTDYADGTAAAEATIKCSRNDVDETKDAAVTKESTSVAPGCLTSGTNVYTASVTTGDGKTFTSEPHEVTAPATGHSYNNYDFHWDDETTYKSATLTWYCGNDGCDYSTQETLNATETVIKPATCTDTGRLLHEVSFEFGGETECRKETTIIPALGHSYDNSCDVRWDDSTYKTATLTWECDNEGCDVNSEGHFKSETLTAVEKVTKPATCTDTGRLLHEVSYEFGGETMYLRETTTIPALGHNCSLELKWDDDTCTSATATVKCSDCDYERDVPVTITAVRTEPTCTEIGYIDYTATADVTYDPKTEGRSPEKDSAQIYGQIELPALGHSFTNYVYNGDATCGGDGTETAKCDRCDVTDTRTAVATAGCDLHTVDGAKVCAVCGKVNGQPKLAAAEANADVNASTIGVHLVVRVGTLPTGQKVITVAFLNNDGQAVQMFGTQKIHVSLAQLKAALGDTEGTGFEHTLTRVNTANGEKQNVGFTVENGTVNFDAAFNGSTACILLVD